MSPSGASFGFASLLANVAMGEGKVMRPLRTNVALPAYSRTWLPDAIAKSARPSPFTSPTPMALPPSGKVNVVAASAKMLSEVSNALRLPMTSATLPPLWPMSMSTMPSPFTSPAGASTGVCPLLKVNGITLRLPDWPPMSSTLLPSAAFWPKTRKARWLVASPMSKSL